MSKSKKILCIIPARGESKGIPRKNIKLLNGQPLISYAIKAVLKSSVIDKLVVSTEDAEIAEVAASFGAEIIKRPKKFAKDTTKTEPVMAHVLEVLEAKEYYPDFISLVQCTSPFLKPEIIRASVSKVLKEGFDSCFTAFLPSSYEFKWKRNKNDTFHRIDYDLENSPRRQDLPKIYHENGAFYITKTELFKKSKNRLGGKPAKKIAIVEMKQQDSLQIDTPPDFWLAEQYIKTVSNKKSDKKLLQEKLKKIEILITDFDGVHTDGMVYLDSKGHEIVRCSRKDGLGIEMLKKAGIRVFIISKETNDVVLARCKKLNIECVQGLSDSEAKLAILKKILGQYNINKENVLYIGDDINDTACLNYAGVSVVTADAHENIRAIADYITSQNGGNHAIREVCELILDSKGFKIEV